MKKLVSINFSVFFVIVFAINGFSYDKNEKMSFLKHMKVACGGKNSCYYAVRKKLDNEVDPANIVYFSCKVEFDGRGSEIFGRCLTDGTLALINYLAETDQQDSAEYVQKWYDDCESWGDNNSETFTCYVNYLRDASGKYVD